MFLKHQKHKNQAFFLRVNFFRTFACLFFKKMKFLRFVCLFCAAILGSTAMAQSQRELQQLMRNRGEYYFTLSVDDPTQIQELSRICSVDGTDGRNVVAYANQQEYDRLIALGFQPELQTPPSLREEAKMWEGGDRATYEWNSYLTYGDYVSMMESFPASAAATGGRTCTLIDLGQLNTSAHRHLYGVRINNGINEGKPKFLYTSTMHGDEVTGMILMLRLIDELCTSTESRIVNLLNYVDIYIFPCTNPDGTYYGGNNTVTGARRANGNNVDLNRNYRDYFNGDHPNTNTYQDETQWTMALADENLFTMAANYHGGAEVMNYCWDWVFQDHADLDWWEYVCTEYVTLARQVYGSYMTDTYSDGVTNGATWYSITGSRQDYMNGYAQCREVTVECSSDKTPSASQLPAFWNRNHNSMLAFMEQARNGVHGVVYDATTGQTIQGVTVSVLNHDISNSYVTTHSVGDFHRPIKGGSYTFVFDKEGYARKFVDVTVTDGQRVDLTVYLTPSNETAMECYEQVNTADIVAGPYYMGHFNGSSLIMPTHNDRSTSTSVSMSTNSLSVVSTGDGFTLSHDIDRQKIALEPSGTTGQYHIVYKGRMLQRSGSSLVWAKPSNASGSGVSLTLYRWYVNSDGIYQQSGSTKYYLYYNNDSFTTNSSQCNITIYAERNCLPREYSVVASAYLEEGGIVEGAGSFLQGETCTLTATANEGYQFFGWSENDVTVSTDAVYSFEVIHDRTLVALFGPTTPMVISVSASPASAGTAIGGGEFYFGETCTVTATPNTDFVFSGWTENGTIVSDEAEYTFMVTGDRALVAYFDFVPPTPMNCYYSVSDVATGDYAMGYLYLNGTTMNILSQNSSSVTTTTATVTSTDYGFSVEEGTTLPQVTLTADGSNGQYIISYNGRYLARSNYGSLTWSTSQSSNGRWYINENGIYVTSNNRNYYLYCNNGSFALSTTQHNNITFYQEGDCPATQSVRFVGSWNWWAPTIEADDLLLQLEAALGTNGILINSQNDGFVRYENGSWSGILQNIVPGQMYRIQTSAPASFELTGNEVNNVTFTIAPGYNWFGYTGSQSSTIGEVFGGNFVPVEGDKINSQDEGFAIFEGGQWTGGLTTLQPGHGYVYISNAQEDQQVTFE